MPVVYRHDPVANGDCPFAATAQKREAIRLHTAAEGKSHKSELKTWFLPIACLFHIIKLEKHKKNQLHRDSILQQNIFPGVVCPQY